jgi:hypothetical protein
LAYQEHLHLWKKKLSITNLQKLTLSQSNQVQNFRALSYIQSNLIWTSHPTPLPPTVSLSPWGFPAKILQAFSFIVPTTCTNHLKCPEYIT